MTPAASNKCNLKPNPVTGFSGPANTETTVQIKDPTGRAIFQTIDYDGNNLGKNVTEATFTILAGNHDLTYVYVAPVAGDPIRIVDPCGKVLETFAADPGNPFVRDIITGV
jgi:hypothetical protein